MDHVIAPLDDDHARAVARLAADLAATLGLAPEAVLSRTPHVTLASYTGLDPARVAAALGPVAAATRPFTVRAHGYGIFTGDADCDLSLHVMVVRTRALDELHRRVHAALGAAGAGIAGTTRTSVWSPHITVLDRGLTPGLLAQAIEALTGRAHRTWSIGVASLTIGSGRGGLGRSSITLALGAAPAS
jgi:2'-5' RNA ligase